MPRSVSLGNLEATVRRLVDSGRYNSESEVLREGVRLVEEREMRLAALDAAITRGLAEIDAGEGLPIEAAAADLNARFARKANERDV